MSKVFYKIKSHKYNAKKVVIDGIEFASKKEAYRYLELKLLLKAGKIQNLILQPKYLLQKGFEYKNKKYRAVYYIADFEYIQNGKKIIEDVKGVKTQVYLLKRKMFLYQYGKEVEFREI